MAQVQHIIIWEDPGVQQLQWEDLKVLADHQAWVEDLLAWAQDLLVWVEDHLVWEEDHLVWEDHLGWEEEDHLGWEEVEVPLVWVVLGQWVVTQFIPLISL